MASFTFDHFPPELLNDYNKQLALKIQELQRTLEEKNKKFQAEEQRCQTLKDHFKNATIEAQNTQLLLEAKNNETNTELHLKQVAERELGRLQIEIQKIDKQVNDIQDQTNLVQNEIFRANEKIDELKTNMGFDQEELEQWTLAEKQKEEDQEVLEKYSKQDEKKIKDLTLESEKWAKLVEEKKVEYEKEITETQSQQIEMEKTAEDFKNVHKERQHLIQQWEGTIEAMNKRDELIQKAGEALNNGKLEIQGKQEELLEQTRRYEDRVQDNKKLEGQIEKSARALENLRDQNESLKNQIKELEEELEVIRNTLSKGSSDLNGKRAEKKYLVAELQKKEEKLAILTQQKEDTMKRMEESQKYMNDLESRSKYVSSLLSSEEAKKKSVEKRLEDLKTQLYHQSQELYKERQKEANLVAEIGGTNSQNKNMLSKISQLDSMVLKQQELLYNIEFQVQQMERRVNRAQGERTEEEKIKLNAQIDKLQKSLEEHEAQFEMIKGEWTKVLSEVRKMKKETDEKELEKARLNEKVHDLTLENNSLEEEMRALTREKEDLLVQHDIQKLQVKRVRDLLRARTDELSGLENRKYQLETLYIEKEQKVKAHKEMLAAEWKAYEDERRRLSLELSNRRVHIDKLKNKYNIMIQRLKPDVEGEEEVSQAQFLIRAIQEREELQRIGDKLDEEIQKLENHDRGLEKTLSLFKSHNINHNAHYKKVDMSDPDICLKMELENKCKDLDTLTSKRIQEQYEYEESANRKQKELEMVLIEQKETEIKRDALSTTKVVLEKDISKLLSSLSTQKTLLKSNVKEIKKVPDAEALLQDVALTDNKIKNRNCLLTLSFISESNPVMKSNLDKILKEEGLSMPVLSRPASSLSVLSSKSTKSSVTRSVNSSQRSSTTSSVRRVAANTSIISLQ